MAVRAGQGTATPLPATTSSHAPAVGPGASEGLEEILTFVCFVFLAVSAKCCSAMPYASNDELPLAVGNHLPPHAPDIFREAFNHAWDEYGGDEERAFRVAWAAVERQYRKHGKDWVPMNRH
jgi:cation transport regulator